MAAPMSPRSMRGDALFDLDQMFDEIQGVVDAVKAMDRELTHLARRASGVNRIRLQVIDRLHEAQVVEDLIPSSLSVAA